MIRVEASRDAIVALDFDDVVYLGYIIVSGQKGWAFLWGQIPGWTQQSFFRGLVEKKKEERLVEGCFFLGNSLCRTRIVRGLGRKDE